MLLHVPMLPTLANTPPSCQGSDLLNSGVLAFSVPPYLNPTDESPRATLSTWSLVIQAATKHRVDHPHVCKRSLRPSRRKRPRDPIKAKNGEGSVEDSRQSSSLSCVRGGSSDVIDDGGSVQDSVPSKNNGTNSHHSSSTPRDPADTSFQTAAPPSPPPPPPPPLPPPSPPPPAAAATPPDEVQQENLQQHQHHQQHRGPRLSDVFQRQRSPVSGASPSSTFGVALVTERSTATGGGKGRVNYSVLADGSLQIGRPSAQNRPHAPASETVRRLCLPQCALTLDALEEYLSFFRCDAGVAFLSSSSENLVLLCT